MKAIIITLSAAMLAFTTFCGVRLYHVAEQRTHVKEVYGQLNSFTYGLLSADTWKVIMRKIVTDRVKDFRFTKDQQQMLEGETAKLLDRLLVDAEEVTRKNKKSLGAIKSYFARSYIKTARQNVSKFAGSINDQIQTPETMEKLKKMALDQFDSFAASTHSSPEDVENFNRLLAENHVKSVDEFNLAATQQLSDLDGRSRYYCSLILGVIVVFSLGWFYVLKHPHLQRSFFNLSVALALIVLFTSLAIPMMEIDARMKSVDLVLIGERIHFNEQVIYYRSKSLMQVVSLLVESKKINSLAVGFLLILFSVMFPITKLMSAVLYLRGNARFNRNKIVQFFAFKSGKWSMADVTVVAIFMAYIGFQSILNTQLPKLNMKTDMVESITTNASSLQAGYLLFTTFVLYSMGLSVMLKKITTPAISGQTMGGKFTVYTPTEKEPALASSHI